jgi:hypothetical protein
MRRRAVCALLAALLAPAIARGADAPDVVRGTWTATNQAKQVFRGGWSAEIAVATPDVAVGSWTLTDDRGNVTMQGTWSARKAPKGWRGAWSARIAPAGQTISGTWAADDSTLKGKKTFAALLRETAVKQIAGVWRAGHAHGTWWLRAS